MSILFVGVDPGAHGGIAGICGSAVSAITMPDSEKGVWDYISSLISPPGNTVGALELVGGYINKPMGPPCPKCKQARTNQPASAAFEFGDSNGCAKMALVGAGLSKTKGDVKLGTFYLVPPQEWQQGLGIDQRRKAENDSQWKSRLKWNAEQLFPKKQYPNLSITLRTADALLIAYYIKQKYTLGR